VSLLKKTPIERLLEHFIGTRADHQLVTYERRGSRIDADLLRKLTETAQPLIVDITLPSLLKLIA
jgi:hypothetical protein